MKQIRKCEMPVEHLRKCCKLSNSGIFGMKYLPMSIHTILRTIPMPWETNKKVKVLYHINGTLSFVLSKPKITKYEFMSKWEEINRLVEEYKKENSNIRICSYPIFDDDSELLDYTKMDTSDRIDGSDKREESNNIYFNNSNINYNFMNYIGKKILPDKNKKMNIYDISLYDTNTLIKGDIIINNIPSRNNANTNIPNINNVNTTNIFDISNNIPHLSKNNLKVNNKILKIKKRKPHTNILKLLRNTRFFQTTKTDWIEILLILIKQGHNILNEILRRKKLHFLYVDSNFNLKTKRSLKTKDRKKSRVGVTFHVVRELMKILKFISDTFILFHKQELSKVELCINLKYLFSNIGTITGIYRYKYKIMKQIKICKDIDKVIEYYNDTTWTELWRRYVFATRGYNSLLKKYITNYTDRIINGREYREIKETKQRKDSTRDIDIKNMLIDELVNDYSKIEINMILLHFNEAWRYWKSNRIYTIGNRKGVYGIDKGDKDIKDGEYDGIDRKDNSTNKDGIGQYNTHHSINPTNNTCITSLDDIINKYILLKADFYVKDALYSKIDSKKDHTRKLGKLTRLFMKEESTRQNKYLQDMSISSYEGMSMYKIAYEYFSTKEKIPFPDTNLERHLENCIINLKIGSTKEEIEFYDDILKDIPHYLYKIKKSILTQRVFRDVECKMTHNYNKYIITYNINYIERLTDAFLSSYLFYESDKKKIFPFYIKPSDELEIKNINSIIKELDKYKNKQNIFLYEGEYKDLMKQIDNNLLSRILRIFIDPILVDYIISRNNCSIFYKDMKYTNIQGYIKGFYISPFIHKCYTLVVDLCVFGKDIFKDSYTRGSYIKWYMRDIDKIYILLEYNKEDRKADYVIKRIEDGNIQSCPSSNYPNNSSSHSNSHHSSNQTYSNLIIHYEIATRLPPSVGRIQFFHISNSTSFRFTYKGITGTITSQESEYSWKYGTSYCKFNISDESLNIFKWRINQIIYLSQCSTFIKTISKWNNTILGFINQYREFIYTTPNIKEIFYNSEKSIHLIIKRGINSKMPIRFPALLFYTPKEYGGLGMYSTMNLYNQNLSKLKINDEYLKIPNLLNYIKTWKIELEESDLVWKAFIQTEKIEPSKGLPRMSTLLQKDKLCYYDRDFRLVNYYKKYYSSKYDPFIYTILRHDGKLYEISNYDIDMINCLGGINNILDHTLYNATYTKSFSKLFWDDSHISKYRNAKTKAQVVGLNQIPNRRFILWWSPTINTSNVYVGYQTQVDNTGILMYGKLPTLKVSFIQIFRNNLWNKIHESILDDLYKGIINICDVYKESHSEGEYNLILVGNFNIHKGSMMKDNGDRMDKGKEYINNTIQPSSIQLFFPCNQLWIHLVLRWGDYGKRSSDKYAKVKYIEYTNNSNEYGIVLVLDLCYNTYSFYGYMDKKIELYIKHIMNKIIKNNLSLHILRERIRKTLEIYTSETEVIISSKEMYYSTLIVDDRLILKKMRIYLVLDPESGNLYIFNINKQEGNKLRYLRNLIAENVFKLADELRKENILIQNDLIQSFESYKIDYKNINIKVYENKFYLKNIIRFTIKLNMELDSKVRIVNLYRNWFGINQFTKFCRLVLILHSYEYIKNKDSNKEVKDTSTSNKVIDIIKDTSTNNTCTKNIWSIYSDKEWVKMEKEYKDIIVDAYINKHNINKNSLMSVDIRDIVFGFIVQPSINKEILNVNDKYYLMNEYIRNRSYINSNISSTGNTYISTISSTNTCITKNSMYKIPRNIIFIFRRYTDISTISFCLLNRYKKYIGIIFIPQFSTNNEIVSSVNLVEKNIIGIIINTDNLNIIKEVIERYKIDNPLIMICKESLNINKEYKIVKKEGTCMIPEKWNYNFDKKRFNNKMKYELVIGIPFDFYSREYYIS